MSWSCSFHLHQRTYHFNFKVGLFWWCCLAIILLSGLGYWQLTRYHFKKELLLSYQNGVKLAPRAFSSLSESPNLSFQHVFVVGHYLNNQTLLIQNQIHQSQIGFEVLTPLQIPGEKKLLLVDRGWIAQSNVNHLEAGSGEQQVTGYIKVINEHQFIMGNNIQQTHFPVIIQKIDFKELSQLTQQSFFPYILRLDANQPHGFLRDWQIISVSPARHLGYALQWFSFALIVLIIFLVRCCESIKTEET